MSVLLSKVSELCELFFYPGNSTVQAHPNHSHSWKDRIRSCKAASNHIFIAKRSRLKLSGRLHRTTSGSGKNKDIDLCGTDPPRWLDIPSEARNRHNCSFTAKLAWSLAALILAFINQTLQVPIVRSEYLTLTTLGTVKC